MSHPALSEAIDREGQDCLAPEVPGQKSNGQVGNDACGKAAPENLRAHAVAVDTVAILVIKSVAAGIPAG